MFNVVIENFETGETTQTVCDLETAIHMTGNALVCGCFNTYVFDIQRNKYVFVFDKQILAGYQTYSETFENELQNYVDNLQGIAIIEKTKNYYFKVKRSVAGDDLRCKLIDSERITKAVEKRGGYLLSSNVYDLLSVCYFYKWSSYQNKASFITWLLIEQKADYYQITLLVLKEF